MYTFRKATIDDLPFIVDLYNHVIQEGGCTADTTTYTLEERMTWYQNNIQEPYGIYIVAQNGHPIGYFYFSSWRGKRASLRGIAELSFYVAAEYRGQGVGDYILQNSLDRAKEKYFTHLLAILLDMNTRSKSLLKKYGFEIVGQLPDIVQSQSMNCGQYIMMKKL